MRLLTILAALPLALGEELVIPQVEAAVAQQLAAYKAYTAYTDGPTGTLKQEAAQMTPRVKAFAVNQNARVAQAAAVNAPYWYEQIQHQGKSAFNTDTSYKVYRNVKDYGAVG